MIEIWKPLPVMPYDYKVSSLGRIKSLWKVVERSPISQGGSKYTRKSKILKPAKNKSGYYKNAISKNAKLQSFLSHRQVAIAFIPNPENKETVNHKNGIKTDNRVENLEWMTKSENCQHSFDTCLQKPKRGELNGCSTTTEKAVLEIREFVKNKKGTRYGRAKLAEKYGITVSCIKDIISKKSWKHI